MSLPPLVLHPPFNITRISHVVLTSRDLDASCRFYCDVLGLVLTAATTMPSTCAGWKKPAITVWYFGNPRRRRYVKQSDFEC